MCEISKISIFILLYLLVGAWIDYKYQELPLIYLIAGGCVSLIYQSLILPLTWEIWLAGVATGICFILFSKWTQEALGYGDGILIMVLGSFLGMWKIAMLLVIAFSVSGVIAIVGMIMKKWKRDARLPFIPFLLVGYLGVIRW